MEIEGGKGSGGDRIGWVLALIAAAVAALWLTALPSSLWLDELDTYFVIKDGVRSAIARTAIVHPQCSQLYAVLMALWVRVAGSSEIALRTPSLVAMALAAYLIYRLGRRLFDRETGVLAALVFVTTDEVAFAAADARSYAAATAACTAATIALLRFAAPASMSAPDAPPDNPKKRRRFLFVYALTAALIVYFHQLFGLMLVAHAVFILYLLMAGETRVTWRELVLVGVLFVVLLGPEASNLASTFVYRARIVYASIPTRLDLLTIWGSPLFVVAVAPVVFFLSSGRRRTLPESAPRATWILLVAWAVIPPLTLFFVTRITSTSMFISRYYLSYEPALAILLGAVLRGIEPRKVRMIAAAAVVVLALFVSARTTHTNENWREMVAQLNAVIDDDMPVVVDSGFVEGADPAWLDLPDGDDRRGFLLAPFAYYPLRGKLLTAPFRLDERTRPFLEGVLRPKLLEADRFVCIGRGRAPRWWILWIDGRFAGDGYEPKKLYDGRMLEAVSYTRRRDANHVPIAMPSTNGSTK